jgi:hypothetical protein
VWLIRRLQTLFGNYTRNTSEKNIGLLKLVKNTLLISIEKNSRISLVA